MTTNHNLHSDQDSLLVVLERLAYKGAIRQLDYQFACFIDSQTHDEQSDSQALAFIAGVVSSELGKGHICLPLFDAQGQSTDLASKLGLFGESALALNTQLQGIDWIQVLQNSNLVGAQGEALPLMFDGERLYLHRYWHYEVTLAEKLNQLGAAVNLQAQEFARLSELLNHLFARQYHFLFNALGKAVEAGSSNQVLRQQLVCDHLDVVASESLDWYAIDSVLSNARKVQDLQQLDELVPLSACVNWQKVAAAVALTRRFAVISGGPGTGKTTTVTKLLAALIEQATHEKNLTIKLVAPTGKAAARLTESIGKAVQELPVSPELKAKIPTESSTLHRLLGAIPNSAEFRHNKQNPLHLDILVIDEASMVDLPMMYKVVDALPKHARLILLGDKDQLASVEAGAVLGDICSFHALGYGKEQASAIAKLTGFDTLAHTGNSASSIADSLCMLQKSYRFDARSGIGQLAKAVNSGSAASVDNVWARDFSDIEHFALSSQHYNQMMQTLVQEYGRYLKRIGQQETDPKTGEPESLTHKAKAVLDTFNQCRLLCAIREGDFGVAGLNQRIEKSLAARKLIQVQDEIWYHGRPVMVTRNDHGLGLYNGDIGICMRDDSEEEPRLKVFFELPDGSVKSVLPSRVPEHETAYAMTIHKSQGSEFDYTLMILPPDFSPILTRELIYTGITRAKKRLALYAELNVLKRGIKVKTTRASGLVHRLTN
ncbi:exodeoxyribonuclease V subunit alpha [Vibrio parahaemolyticus]|uniref:exodeoxyribonuclease V subunit alpha n=1 Tax=Vibrio parahaemolyticus TaxID=670 RepID=UPI000A39F522|nr:exodeoxyribonuclease V subunit alpha [Vibrio parahaemolyticus]OUJ63539.1 exodeoxyribonuclease V subunit alpha [Vibrio parahaemolyticus]TOA42502.1 exodeoxyribonuclease V subunit alpha [Vibrio parahaemolyticus]